MTGLHLPTGLLFNKYIIDYIIGKAMGFECSYPEPDVTGRVKKAACDYLLTCVWEHGDALDAMTQDKLASNIEAIREGKPVKHLPCSHCKSHYGLGGWDGQVTCTECSL